MLSQHSHASGYYCYTPFITYFIRMWSGWQSVSGYADVDTIHPGKISMMRCNGLMRRPVADVHYNKQGAGDVQVSTWNPHVLARRASLIWPAQIRWLCIALHSLFRGFGRAKKKK